jgi:chromosome segregation ATPase
MTGDMTVPLREPPKGVTFEEVWTMFQENAQHLKETERLLKELMAETDRQIKETAQQMKETDQRLEKQKRETDQRLEKQRRETDQQLKKQRKETDQQLKKRGIYLDQQLKKQRKETDQRLGKLGIRLGDIVEHLMTPNLHKKFERLGFSFNHSSRNHEIHGSDKQSLAEIDVLLENGEYAMAVEVKTRLTTEDVKDHVKRMEILRRVADEHNDTRKYLGAVAGAVVTPEASAYALKNGFFVIVPSGETVDIKVPEDSRPRIWQYAPPASSAPGKAGQ